MVHRHGAGGGGGVDQFAYTGSEAGQGGSLNWNEGEDDLPNFARPSTISA